MEREGPARRGDRPGRGPKVRTAVLTAALAELVDVGYAALTVENVAQRANVHKTTIYRRWGDRDSLVADAMTNLARASVPVRDTRDIVADLRHVARSFVAFLSSPAGRAVVATLQSDASRMPEVVAARRRFFEDRFRQADSLVAGAIARGELPAETDTAELMRTILAPIYLRLLVTAEPVSESVADSAARVALAAARAGALRAERG
jgi:AcrR family transcriptional regulator